MSNPNAPQQWTPLSALRTQYESNLSALRSRDAALAATIEAAASVEPYFLTTVGNTVRLAKAVGETLHVLPNPVPPVEAAHVITKLFPGGKCTESVMVAGIDQGWIWDALHKLECKHLLPMHRPPLYFLAHDVTRLWAAMHFQDWTTLLADERVTIFAGPDAAVRYRQRLVSNPRLTLPRLSLTVEPAIWKNSDPALINADATYKAILLDWEANLQRTLAQLQSLYPTTATADIAARLSAGQRLRVLGITSRYTTFLQHSMRDWLAGFRALGHETKLAIEAQDHQTMSNVVYLQLLAEFKPDLIVIIDHYRTEYTGLPAGVPVVMWVQDYLPNILDAKAGAAQGPLDFCLGFGRHHLVHQYGYPAERYLPAPTGVNEERFGTLAANATPAELARYACDVSYVSHASATAEALFAQHTENASPVVRTFMGDVFEELRAHYAAGGGVVGRPATLRMMNAALARRGLSMSKADLDQACALFTHTIGNALFRHQSLNWLADLGVDLHLYGRGWENHPRFKRFARGVADNNVQLAHIYRASRVNLQVTPHGVVHPRLLDGLTAGAFFLLRYSDGDAVGKQHRQLFDYCQQHGIETDDQLATAAASDAHLSAILRQIDVCEGYADHPREYPVLQVNRTHADTDFFVAAGSVWPDEYDRVTFDSIDQLRARLTHFLQHPEERQRLSNAMRGPVVERCSYKAINRRLLAMIGQQMSATLAGGQAEVIRRSA